MKVSKILIVAIFSVFLGLIGGYLIGMIGDNSGYENGSVLNFVKPKEKFYGYHYSSSKDKSFFDDAYSTAAAREASLRPDALGLVVPHHLVASAMIAGAFNSVTSDKPLTVAVISPNHFFKGRGQIISSQYDWQTPYGILKSEKNIIDRLQADGAINIDENPFEDEHGISNLVSFIKKSLPNARIVPVIVKDTLSQDQSDEFAKKLSQALPQNSLVVASFDFSHYLPGAAADLHDSKSLAVLSDFDYESIKSLDIDSKPGLRIFLKYLDARGAANFSLLENSNSAKILNDAKITETTSYIAGRFSIGNKGAVKQANLLAFGDLMLDRYVKKSIDKYGQDYPLVNMKRFLSGNDLTLANLEGSFTDYKPKALNPNNTSFTFSPELVSGLKKDGFNIFCLSNNHTQDFGKAGLLQSQAYLDKNDISHFGNFMNDGDISTIKTVRGIKIGFVGYNEFSNPDLETIVNAIKKVKKETDYTVVFAHWGIEYQNDFSLPQQEKGRKFIDAGADIVLGGHPHVTQPIEIYKNKPIFYSMGNFVFDQIFSPEVQQGLAVGVVLSKEKMEFYLFPLQNKNFQVNFAAKEKRDIILKWLANKSVAPQIIKNQIIEGKITIDIENEKK